MISLQLVSIMSKASRSVRRYHQLLSTYMHSKVNALHLPARLGNVKRFLLTIRLKELMLQSCLDAPLRWQKMSVKPAALQCGEVMLTDLAMHVILFMQLMRHSSSHWFKAQGQGHFCRWFGSATKQNKKRKHQVQSSHTCGEVHLYQSHMIFFHKLVS